MNYRVGWPFWKAFARHGGRLKLAVDFVRDDEAGVFVATSPDLRGFVLEAATLDELVAEMPAAIDSLMREYLHAPLTNPPVAEFRMAMTSC